MRLIDADLLKENCKITGEFDNNFRGVDLITLGEVIDKQPTFGDWTLIKDDLPPDDVEVLFKTKKYGRKYVGKKRTHTHYDGGKDIVYRCVTARGSEVTGLKPVAWMYLPDLEDVKMELVDRSQLGDFQNLKGKYEWLLRLDDDKLSNEVIYHDTVQTALSELLRFVDDVANLPELHFGADGEPFDPRMETSDEWLDMN